jgi:hypothetical protein
MDIADRMQCPADFVGLPALTALAAVLGRKVGIRPKREDDSTRVSNLWCITIGRPGALKSPALDEVLKPLNWFEARAAVDHKQALERFKLDAEAYELEKSTAKKAAVKSGKFSRETFDEEMPGKAPEAPKARRYVTMDTTYEKLGEILASNPNGVLVHRDEMLWLLKHLDREEQVSTRQFYMTAWNGNSSYTFDRLVRGRISINGACIGMLGAATTDGIANYVHHVRESAGGGDGLVQRFSLLAWPDVAPAWRRIDRYPDKLAKDNAWRVFDYLDQLNQEAVGAQIDEYGTLPFLRLDARAQGLFDDWWVDLEVLLRSGTLTTALESHLAKYRGLVPTL